jgi:hypothetical protein
MTHRRRFLRTAAALVEYDRIAPALQTQWAAVENPDQLATVQQMEKRFKDNVRDAFYQDTKRYNSRENCQLTSIEWLRKIVAGDQLLYENSRSKR